MENTSDWEMKNLINELTQGRELAKQLQIHLNVSCSSHETRKNLVHKILNSYDNALSMLNCGWTFGGGDQQEARTSVAAMSESPRFFHGSPNSEDSDRDFKDQEHKEASMKRKSIPRWTKQVQVCPGSGLEGPLDDGYNWRKYGQKDILGAKFPRGYYRCTHRNVQGCLATKQIQRSDENPTIFEITYRGRHTCTPFPSHSIPPLSSLENHEPNMIENSHQFVPPTQQNQPEILLNFKTGLKVITNEFDTPNHQRQPLSSLSHSSTFLSYQTGPKPENFPFLSSMVDPSFMSTVTSGSNDFLMSPPNVQTLESELNEIVYAVTSATNSPPIVSLDYPFDHMEYDSNFTFDNPGLFY